MAVFTAGTSKQTNVILITPKDPTPVQITHLVTNGTSIRTIPAGKFGIVGLNEAEQFTFVEIYDTLEEAQQFYNV